MATLQSHLAHRIVQLTAALLIASLTGCTTKSKQDRLYDAHTFNTFPTTKQLTAMPVKSLDDEIRVIGDAAVFDDGYIFYQYNAGHFLIATDFELKHIKELASKGNGPGEVTGVTGALGYTLADGSIAVFDPYATKMHGSNPIDNYALHLYEDFSPEFISYSPGRVIQMPDGNYIATRGDFKYGLVRYDPANKTTTELPLGYDFKEIDTPDYDHVSMRVIEYNAKNDALVELYGCLPSVIVRDGEGNVKATFTYEGYSPVTDTNGHKQDCFADIRLTDNYIWLLYGDDDIEDSAYHVLVINYDGDPIADLEIEQAYAFAVDEHNKRILAINPNCDEANIKIYNIPDNLSS